MSSFALRGASRKCAGFGGSRRATKAFAKVRNEYFFLRNAAVVFPRFLPGQPALSRPAMNTLIDKLSLLVRRVLFVRKLECELRYT